MFKSLSRGLTLGLLALVFVAASLDAQGVGIRRSQSEGRGWFGMSASVTANVTDGNATVFIVVRETIDGSPADAAGLIPGDRIHQIDGRPITLRRWDQLTSRLTPGDHVLFSVQRDDHAHDVVVRVGLRPSSVPSRDSSDTPVGYSNRWESVQNSITSRIAAVLTSYASEPGFTVVVNDDSISEMEVRIVESIERIGRAVREGVVGSGFALFSDSSGSVDLRFGPGRDERIATPERVLVLRSRQVPSAFELIETAAALPFEYYVLNSPEADSVKTVLLGTRMKLVQNQEAQRRRREELALARLRVANEPPLNDDELVHLRTEGIRLETEVETITGRLKMIGDAVREDSRVSVRERAPVLAVAPARLVGGATMFSARLVGRNFVAGAQLTDLKPGLSDYFGVRHGVLVMDVLEGSLAAQADLTPGDVIIRVDRAEVSSMNELRAALATPGRRSETTIIVVRKGDLVRLTLPR